MEPEFVDEGRMMRDILSDLAELTNETRNSRQELKEIETELQLKFNCQKITRLFYEVERELIQRSFQDIEHTLRSLQNQRKMILELLRKLEQE